jgi:hypothetical protein
MTGMRHFDLDLGFCWLLLIMDKMLFRVHFRVNDVDSGVAGEIAHE